MGKITTWFNSLTWVTRIKHYPTLQEENRELRTTLSTTVREKDILFGLVKNWEAQWWKMIDTSDKQFGLPLPPHYRWVRKDTIESKIKKGYLQVGVRPITFGDNLVLMKKKSNLPGTE